MSKIKELVWTKHLTLPKATTPYLYSSKLLKEYYTIEYVSGDKSVYNEYINLPKHAKKMLRGCGLTYERTRNNYIVRDTVYRNY